MVEGPLHPAHKNCDFWAVIKWIKISNPIKCEVHVLNIEVNVLFALLHRGPLKKAKNAQKSEMNYS